MTSFLYRMPVGIPGSVTRMDQSTLVPEIVTPFGTTGAPTAYGVPVIADTTTGNVGNMRTVVVTDTAAAVYGFLVRAFPTADSQDAVGTSTPPKVGTVTVMKRGFMSVVMSGTAAAVKGAPVYIWVDASATTHVQGGVEAAATTDKTIALANTTFMGPADANGITEIGYNL